jgi:hypothetical protein
MPANVARSKKTGATVLSQALEMKGPDLPPEAARFLLGLGIRAEHQKRMLELLEKQQQGGMPPEDREELESYVEADNVLSILRAQAILALKRAGQKP